MGGSQEFRQLKVHAPTGGVEIGGEVVYRREENRAVVKAQADNEDGIGVQVPRREELGAPGRSVADYKRQEVRSLARQLGIKRG
jgi:hypothetical protein